MDEWCFYFLIVIDFPTFSLLFGFRDLIRFGDNLAVWRNFCFTLYFLSIFLWRFLGFQTGLRLVLFLSLILCFCLMKSSQVETETKPEIEDPEKKKKKEEKVCYVDVSLFELYSSFYSVLT